MSSPNDKETKSPSKMDNETVPTTRPHSVFYKDTLGPKRKLSHNECSLEEKVVRTVKPTDAAPSGPPTVFLETDHGLETMTVEAAKVDTIHATAFTGKSEVHFSKEELAVERDAMGLPVSKHHEAPDEHKSHVLSRGASGSHGVPVLCTIHH